MKCYAPPESIPVPVIDYSKPFDMAQNEADEAKFVAALERHLKANGFNGPLTGKLVRFHVADGYAEYMVADNHRSMALVHLPFADAYFIPAAHMRGLRKMDIVEQIKREEGMAALLATR